MILLNPYIGFPGQAREAAQFYQTVFGGELNLTTFKEGGMSPSPADDDKIMHAMLKAPNGITLMLSDVPESMKRDTGSQISISLSGEAVDGETLKKFWEGLSAGGTIEQPLVAAPWGDEFGMLADKFGIRWMVNIAGQKS